MPETALDRLLSTSDESDEKPDFLSNMSDTAFQSLANKVLSTVEKVELEEQPVQPSVEQKEKPKNKQKGQLNMSVYEIFIKSLALELLEECKNKNISIRGFDMEQVNLLYDYIYLKVKENK